MNVEDLVSGYKQCQDLTRGFYNLSGPQNYIEPIVLDKNSKWGPFKYIAGTEQSRNWYGYQDPNELDIEVTTEEGEHLQMVRPGDVVFDCGSHTGFMTVCFALAAGPSGHVIAFDPYPQNVDLVEANAILNGLNNVTTVQKAIGSQHRFLALSQDHQSAIKSISNLIKTFETSIDSYKKFKPDFIKLDVEGFEVEALKGAQEVLKQRPRFNIEIHGPMLHHFNHNVKNVIDLLPSEAEYDLYIKEHATGVGPLGGFRRINSLDVVKDEHFTTVLGIPK
jgi:FkbM family methyltransferase